MDVIAECYPENSTRIANQRSVCNSERSRSGMNEQFRLRNCERYETCGDEGKHIVCIDANRKAAAAIQTAYRGEPRTPINFNSGSSAESRGKY